MLAKESKANKSIKLITSPVDRPKAMDFNDEGLHERTQLLWTADSYQCCFSFSYFLLSTARPMSKNKSIYISVSQLTYTLAVLLLYCNNNQ